MIIYVANYLYVSLTCHGYWWMEPSSAQDPPEIYYTCAVQP